MDELPQYAGQWMAFSSDGSRLIVAADDLLDELMRKAGEDSESVGLHRIESNDFLGGRCRTAACYNFPILKNRWLDWKGQKEPSIFLNPRMQSAKTGRSRSS